MQRTKAKRRKIERSTKWLSQVSDIFSYFDQNIQNFDISKTNAYKLKVLEYCENLK